MNRHFETPRAILMRGITESVFTLAWVNKDPELAGIVWLLDEIRTRLNQHKEVARLVRNARRRSRRRAEAVPPLPEAWGEQLQALCGRRFRSPTRARGVRVTKPSASASLTPGRR